MTLPRVTNAIRHAAAMTMNLQIHSIEPYHIAAPYTKFLLFQTSPGNHLPSLYIPILLVATDFDWQVLQTEALSRILMKHSATLSDKAMNFWKGITFKAMGALHEESGTVGKEQPC